MQIRAGVGELRIRGLSLQPTSARSRLGRQLLQPLAIAVMGGVAVSMILSLLLTPVVFFTLRRAATIETPCGVGGTKVL